MTTANLKALYALLGASRSKWNEFIEDARPPGAARDRKQSLLAAWHKTIVETAREIEWAFETLEYLKAEEAAVALAKERTGRRSATRVKLRDYLTLPADATDHPLRTLRLCSRSGAEMRLECLSFEGSNSGQIVTLNSARDLFQKGFSPNALYGLYYIRDGQRSAGYGWDKPFLDEIFVLPGDER